MCEPILPFGPPMSSHDVLAQRYRPRDRDSMRAAVVELRQRLALTPRDIAALQLSEAAVRELLGTDARMQP